MTNTTPVYWDVDGVSIQNFAWNIRTLTGRSGVANFRGSNVNLAYYPGTFHKAKTIDSKALSLSMWVQGSTADGGAPTARSTELEFQKNWRALRQLFWRDDSMPFTLTKRWIDPDTFEVMSASALVENTGVMAPTMQGNAHATFSVDLLMLEGLFFGEEQTTVVEAGETVVIANPGDARTHKITMDFEGQLTNPVLTNATFAPQNWVKLGSSVAIADTVTLDVDKMSARRDSDGANLIGAVTRSGMRQWFGLASGSNIVTLTRDAGSGQAIIKWRPAYFD